MKYIEVTTARGKSILINIDQIITVSTTTEEDRENGKFCEILLNNNGICKVKNTYAYVCSAIDKANEK